MEMPLHPGLQLGNLQVQSANTTYALVKQQDEIRLRPIVLTLGCRNSLLGTAFIIHSFE